MKKLNKILCGGLVLGTMFALVGCTPGYTDKSGDYSVLPPTLKDCSITAISSKNGGHLTVVRCPNSQTTADAGKSGSVTTIEDQITVNGVEYIKKN
jgi:hypothetical protein